MLLNIRLSEKVFVPVVLNGFFYFLSLCLDFYFYFLGTLVTLPSATSHVFPSVCVCVCVSLTLILSVSFTHQFSQTARSLVL